MPIPVPPMSRMLPGGPQPGFTGFGGVPGAGPGVIGGSPQMPPVMPGVGGAPSGDPAAMNAGVMKSIMDILGPGGGTRMFNPQALGQIMSPTPGPVDWGASLRQISPSNRNANMSSPAYLQHAAGIQQALMDKRSKLVDVSQNPPKTAKPNKPPVNPRI